MNRILLALFIGLIAGAGFLFYSGNLNRGGVLFGGRNDNDVVPSPPATGSRTSRPGNSKKYIEIQEDVGAQIQALVDNEEFKLYDLLLLAESAGAAGKESCSKFLDEVDRRLGGELRESAYARALEAFVIDNPDWVFEQTSRLGVGRLNRGANYKLLSTLASKYPETAVDFVNKMDFPEERESGIRSLRASLVANPELVHVLLNREKMTEEVKSGLVSIAGDVWKGDVADLIEKSGVETGPEFREKVLSAMAERRPLDVLKYYEDAEDAEPSQKTLSRLAAGLATDGASQSIDVVLQAQGFSKRNELAGMLYSRWLTDDSLGASKWLQATESLEQDAQLKSRLVSIIVARMKAEGETDLANEWSKLIEK